MGLWLVVGAMTLVALALVVVPLLRRGAVAGRRLDYEIEISKAQLRDVDRDLERGQFDADEAEAARVEIKRRLLAASRHGDDEAKSGGDPAGRKVAIVIALLVVLGALPLYGWLGSPDEPARPFAERGEERRLAAESEVTLPDIETMVGRLEARLAESPDDLDGWMMLARSYQALDRFPEAADAWQRAIDLRGDLAELYAARGEVLVAAADGEVTEVARAAFAAALERDPDDPRGLFYSGLALAQRGELQAALDVWVDLAEGAPADTPWLPDLNEQIRQLAAELGQNPDDIVPPPVARAGPSPDQMAAAREMPPEDRMAMIRNMVGNLAERLEADPDDVEGWRMLARSYGVLGEADKAAIAWKRLAELAPGDAEVQLDYAQAMLAANGDAALSDPAFNAAMQRLLTIEPDNEQALFYLGEIALARGDQDAAREQWVRLQSLLPPESPRHAEISRRLDALDP